MKLKYNYCLECKKSFQHVKRFGNTNLCITCFNNSTKNSNNNNYINATLHIPYNKKENIFFSENKKFRLSKKYLPQYFFILGILPLIIFIITMAIVQQYTIFMKYFFYNTLFIIFISLPFIDYSEINYFNRLTSKGEKKINFFHGIFKTNYSLKKFIRFYLVYGGLIILIIVFPNRTFLKISKNIILILYFTIFFISKLNIKNK